MENHIQEKLPQRKSPRATFHDYSGGLYFITICTKNKIQYFGKIINGEIQYSTIGLKAKRDFETLPNKLQYCDIPLFVVMPNHIHAIIHIFDVHHLQTYERQTISEEAITSLPEPDTPRCVPTSRSTLSVIVGSLKSGVTRFANQHSIPFAWQSRYHDHIIRNQCEANTISEYIQHNVIHWEQDCFFK